MWFATDPNLTVSHNYKDKVEKAKKMLGCWKFGQGLVSQGYNQSRKFLDNSFKFLSLNSFQDKCGLQVSPLNFTE